MQELWDTLTCVLRTQVAQRKRALSLVYLQLPVVPVGQHPLRQACIPLPLRIARVFLRLVDPQTLAVTRDQ
jgi:hypothetical protein